MMSRAAGPAVAGSHSSHSISPGWRCSRSPDCSCPEGQSSLTQPSSRRSGRRSGHLGVARSSISRRSGGP
eukprot:12224271-Heterocapsa_arctica.AAC.1